MMGCNCRLLLLWMQTVVSMPFTLDDGMLPPPPINMKRDIPEKVLIGYASHAYENVKKAVVEDGVNIVIWAFIDIVHVGEHQLGDALENEVLVNQDGMMEEARISSSPRRALMNITATNNIQTHARIKTGLDLEKIKTLIEELDEAGHSDVVHLGAIGGWNGPHLDPSLNALEWYRGWKESMASSIFHGIDWDLEGNDNLASPYNVFTLDCLEKMVEISRLMKSDGYIVTMAPPQSYLDFNTSNFSRFVNLTVPDRRWHKDFHYFGCNVYAYILAKCGDCIDLISLQLYESFSDAAMSVFFDGMAADDYLFSFVWDHVVIRDQSVYIDFSQDPSLEMQGQKVEIPLSKLVLGLANGWALNSDQNKTLYVSSTECEEAYLKLKESKHGDLTPRGFMFWTIEERGSREVYLARGIGKFIHKGHGTKQ